MGNSGSDEEIPFAGGSGLGEEIPQASSVGLGKEGPTSGSSEDNKSEQLVLGQVRRVPLKTSDPQLAQDQQ